MAMSNAAAKAHVADCRTFAEHLMKSSPSLGQMGRACMRMYSQCEVSDLTEDMLDAANCKMEESFTESASSCVSISRTGRHALQPSKASMHIQSAYSVHRIMDTLNAHNPDFSRA